MTTISPTFLADVRRLGALGRAELTLLIRNTAAMVNAILMPLLLVAIVSLASPRAGRSASPPPWSPWSRAPG